MKREAAVVLESLRIGYPSARTPLLQPLSASSDGGELVAVLGRNGIGKSTLLRTIAGLQPSLGGEVVINGRSISEYSRYDLARNAGYISTEVIRVSNMKVYDLVSLGRFPHTNWLGVETDDDKKSVREAIHNAGLDHLKERYLSEISDGERQKAMIARVLSQDTSIMIMDEPTAFLDIAGKYEIMTLLMRLAGKGKTVIFSTHDFNIAINHADKIWLLHDNALVEGAPEDLISGGTFDHLFPSSVVRFNSSDGTFEFENEPRGYVSLEGKGTLRDWTEKALTRAGYIVSGSQPGIIIRIGENNQKRWTLFSGAFVTECSSIYEMIRRLKKISTSRISGNYQ